jgi:hypothetical protein
MENTQKYDKQATDQYIQDSNFVIYGFMEQWFSNGKLINEIKHHSIPEGMTPGYSSDNIFEIDQDMIIERGKKRIRLHKGDKVMREVIAICGRLKK